MSWWHDLEKSAKKIAHQSWTTCNPKTLQNLPKRKDAIKTKLIPKKTFHVTNGNDPSNHSQKGVVNQHLQSEVTFRSRWQDLRILTVPKFGKMFIRRAHPKSLVPNINQIPKHELSSKLISKTLPLKSFSGVKRDGLQAKKRHHLLLELVPITIDRRKPMNAAQHPRLVRVDIFSPKFPDGVVIRTKTCRA